MELVEHVNNIIDREGYTRFGEQTANAEDSLDIMSYCHVRDTLTFKFC